MASNYMAEYEKWLNSDVLTAEEHAELLAIQDDPKEIESRFYGPLEFGTAGLRGTMKVGLHHMNTYVVRHATQGFATSSPLRAGSQRARRRHLHGLPHPQHGFCPHRCRSYGGQRHPRAHF
ncbi:MAG: hypothetical protein ACLUBZ_16510 [Ruthenibacterium lactatiformans]|uniref:hypothetical protein n=1 Tax=Ruthenibacterium lactatiformans TaxID=1550024 RepID=UPI0039927DA5